MSTNEKSGVPLEGISFAPLLEFLEFCDHHSVRIVFCNVFCLISLCSHFVVFCLSCNYVFAGLANVGVITVSDLPTLEVQNAGDFWGPRSFIVLTVREASHIIFTTNPPPHPP